MEPRSLSATAIKAFMACEAHYKAQYVDRIRISGPGGGAGDLGSLLHDVLEWWVKIGRHVSGSNSKDLADKCRELAPNYGIDGNNLKVANKMLFAWYDRWMADPPHEVVSAEVKSSFPLKIKVDDVVYETGVTYIWDRCDLLPDGSILVTDYKSWMKCMTGDEIFSDTQVRLYALSAAIQFKDAQPESIWVALDQLRYGMPVAVRFTRDDIRSIFNWLKGIYEQIIRSDGTRETVGDACRWCVRSPECESFNRAVDAGTILSYNSPAEAARKVAEINAVLGALMDNKAVLLTYLESYLEDQEILEEKIDVGLDKSVHVKITPKNSRKPDHDAIVDVIGTDIASRYGKLGVTALDELLEGDELDDEQKAAVRRHIKESVTTSINAKFAS